MRRPMSFNTHGLHRSLPSDQSGFPGDTWRSTKSVYDQAPVVESGLVSWVFQLRCPGRPLNISCNVMAHGSRCQSMTHEIRCLRAMFYGGTNLRKPASGGPNKTYDTRRLRCFSAFGQTSRPNTYTVRHLQPCCPGLHCFLELDPRC